MRESQAPLRASGLREYLLYFGDYSYTRLRAADVAVWVNTFVGIAVTSAMLLNRDKYLPIWLRKEAIKEDDPSNVAHKEVFRISEGTKGEQHN